MSKEFRKYLQKIIDKAGSQTRVAESIGKKPQHISYLMREAKELPAEYVLPLEEHWGISRHLLRPDIYPKNEG